MKIYVSCMVILLLFSYTYGQVSDYAEVEIKKTEYNVISLEKTLLKQKYRIKIFDEKGEKYGNIEIPFDKNSHLSSFNGCIYDSKGNKVKKISKSELYTVSNFDNYSLYSDSKVKKTNIHYYNYPYFVDYEYEVEYNYFLGCYWPLIDDYNLASKEVELTIKITKELKVNYRLNRFYGTVDSLIHDNSCIYTWKAKDVNSIPDEDLSYGFLDLVPSIIVSPSHFSYEGYFGKNDTWENYGKWIWNLLENRNSLPNDTKARIHQLTDSISDTITKIKCIYQYFQTHTRYISIQKGIGGFQPASASSVDICKYGDCKALSNYLKSLLSVIGVNAIYTEIGSGNNKKIKWENFPSVFQTNHVILSVPFHKDTIWLECTNHSIPFGYIGNGNSNRKALYVDETGGNIVNTPKYGLGKSYQITNARINIDINGSMQCSAHYIKSGTLMDDLIYLNGCDRKNQEKEVVEKYPSINLEISNFKISETDDTFPRMTFDINMSEHSFLSKSGNYYSFKSNYLNRFKNYLSNNKRNNDIYISYGYITSDTIRYILSDSIKPEFIPEPKLLECAFGKFYVEYFYNKNEFLYVRNFKLYEGTYSKKKYAELNNFFNEIQIADNQNIILKKEK